MEKQLREIFNTELSSESKIVKILELLEGKDNKGVSDEEKSCFYSKEIILKELKDCEHLDYAKMTFTSADNISLNVILKRYTDYSENMGMFTGSFIDKHIEKFLTKLSKGE